MAWASESSAEGRTLDAVIGGQRTMLNVSTKPVEVHSAHIREEQKRQPAASQQPEKKVLGPDGGLTEAVRVVTRELQGFSQLRRDAGRVFGRRGAFGEYRVRVHATKLDDAPAVGIL